MDFAHVRQETWSAVKCNRICSVGGSSPEQGRVQRPGRVRRLPTSTATSRLPKARTSPRTPKVVAARPRADGKCRLERVPHGGGIRAGRLVLHLVDGVGAVGGTHRLVADVIGRAVELG